MRRHHCLCVLFCATQALLETPSAATGIDPTDINVPVVITSTRLRQSISDVPASVTVITDEMLRRFGIRSVPDALRLVPGMAVTQVRGSDFSINYHGTRIVDLARNRSFTTEATVRHLSNPTSRYFQDFGKTIESHYNNPMQYLLTLRVAY